MDDDEEDAAPARKVFVLNAGEYTGKVLCKRFLASEDEKFEILGTLRDGAQKPSWVKRVVDTTPEALLAAFRECELTVLDCLNAMDGSEALLEAISGVKEFEDEKVLIGISSVMTWTRTTPDAEEPEKALTEEEYKRRRPHSSFKELLALEKLVTKSKRPGLRTHVVAAGLVYGQDEDLFHDLFKTAWNCKPLTLASIGDGSNLLPTIHVSDLCSVVLKLLKADSLPYLLAVDQGQAQEEAAQTLKTVVEKLSAVLGMGGVGVMAPEQVRLQKDYEFFQVGIRLDGAAVGEMGFEWQCQEGLLAHMDKVVQEYRESRGLLPLRVLVDGNDDLAKTALAASLAAEYKVPHIVASAAVEAAKAGDDALATELKAAAEPVPDALVAKALTAALSTTACKNQGYFLQGFPEQLEQAAALFGAGGARGGRRGGGGGGGGRGGGGEAGGSAGAGARARGGGRRRQGEAARAAEPRDDGGGGHGQARRVRDAQRRGQPHLGARAQGARGRRAAALRGGGGHGDHGDGRQGARLPGRAAQLRPDGGGARLQGGGGGGGQGQGGGRGGGDEAGAGGRGGGREEAARGARRAPDGGAAAAGARAARGARYPAAQLPDAERHPHAHRGAHRGVQAQARRPRRLPRRVALQEQPRRGGPLRVVRSTLPAA